MNNKLPVGIFDSGIGGLTVVREIVSLLPQENIIYLGDTARVPYGSRGKEVITTFAKELVNFLLDKNVKCLVVACNTISATCLPELQSMVSIPIIGVIHPSAEMIVNTTTTKKVGVIGTKATISSKAYSVAISKLDSNIEIISQACPLFVPLVEEGLADSEISYLLANKYLSTLKGIDTLHLGCTHYPLLEKTIRKVMGDHVAIVDSAKPTAEILKKILTEKKLLNLSGIKGKREFYVTDLSTTVYEIASSFLGENIKRKIKKVNL